MLNAKTRRQFFFVITTTASTHCLVQNFQLICYLQQTNAKWQYNNSGSSSFSKWPNDQMVAVVKDCCFHVHGKKRLQRKMTKDYYWIGAEENISVCAVSHKMTTTALFSCLNLKNKYACMFSKLSYPCNDRKLFYELVSTH